MPPADHKVRDLGQCTIALREGLVWTPHTAGGQTYYVVEDPLTAKFFRVGLVEYTFISQLDGSVSIDQALRATAQVHPHSNFSEDEAAAVVNWLVETGLARTVAAAAGPTPSAGEAAEARNRWARWNPIIFRLPLLQPATLFRRLLRPMGWLYGRAGIALWAIVGMLAVYQLATHWDRLAVALQGVLAPSNWFWLPVCWLVLKLVHELGHGLVCTRHGGYVREAGVLVILLVPVTYVDVTSTWRFRSRWPRIATSAAGMYTELLVASLAALVWTATEPGIVNSLCVNVMVTASVSSLVFNLNFLMRFDGYYLLSDLLEIENLYAQSQQLLLAAGRRVLFLGNRPSGQLPNAPAKRAFLFLYGVAAFLWKILVCVGLLIGASVLFRGAGIALAVVGAAVWVAVPLAGFLRNRMGKQAVPRGRLGPAYYFIGAAVTLAALLLSAAPWPGSPRAPAVVQYAPLAVIRADSPGFVRRVMVRPQQPVVEGQTLAVMENKGLAATLKDLELAVRQSDIVSRVREASRQMAGWQAEVKKRQSLEEKRRQKRSQLEKLTVRAPADGTVIARNLDLLRGAYLTAGSEILAVGSERSKKLRVAIAQQDIEAFRAHIGKEVTVLIPGHPCFQARLSQIEPRASLDCPPALSAANGGPLPVRPRAAVAESADAAEQVDRLLAPRVTGTVELTDQQSLQLNAGRLAVVTVPAAQHSIAEHLRLAISRWLRQQLRRRSG